jgi:hypothetical protein
MKDYLVFYCAFVTGMFIAHFFVLNAMIEHAIRAAGK